VTVRDFVEARYLNASIASLPPTPSATAENGRFSSIGVWPHPFTGWILKQ
jgi:hypothetical protein